ISGAVRASEPELLTTVPPASSLITGNSSWTDLMRAAANGNIEAVKRHLADKDKKNSDGGTALMVAARAGRVEVVEFLDPTDKNGVTALMRAAEKGAVEDVALLIQCGTNKQDNYGYTALMYAAENGHTERVKLLAEQESGTQAKDSRTALVDAVTDNSVGCARLFAEREGGMETACVRRGFPPGTPVLDIGRQRVQ
ncbi:Ankyrin repeat protein, partial [Giardia duodenalis]